MLCDPSITSCPTSHRSAATTVVELLPTTQFRYLSSAVLGMDLRLVQTIPLRMVWITSLASAMRLTMATERYLLRCRHLITETAILISVAAASLPSTMLFHSGII